MALDDKTLFRVLRNGGLTRQVTQALIDRLNAGGGASQTGYVAGFVGANLLGDTTAPVDWIALNPLGAPGVVFAGNRTTFDAGTYQIAFEFGFGSATIASITAQHYAIAGEGSGFFDVGFDGWATSNNTGPGIITLPPLKMEAGDWIEWNGVADVAAQVSPIMHITRVA